MGRERAPAGYGDEEGLMLPNFCFSASIGCSLFVLTRRCRLALCYGTIKYFSKAYKFHNFSHHLSRHHSDASIKDKKNKKIDVLKFDYLSLGPIFLDLGLMFETGNKKRAAQTQRAHMSH